MTKPFKSAQFQRADVDIISEKTGFDGFFKLAVTRLRHRLFRGGWSAEIEREMFVKTEAAAAVLYDPANDLIGLVEQFRAGALDSEYGPWCLEVVAGMLEPGEHPDDLIAREIQEEAGLAPNALHKITAYYSTPGACNEKVHLYCAEVDLSAAGGFYGLDSENEDIQFSVHPAPDVFAAMLNSRMNNAATLLGLQWLAMNRERLIQAYKTKGT
ncbi:MAG: NUDIX domain-containing protein [Marinagarivorans sp.]|nr:NUDIX domain-containing protein [Marinagarivorans sp.]